MIKPTKAYSLTFVSDGASTTASFDLSLLPVREDFRGSLPLALLNLAVTNLGLITATATLAGSTITLTFSAAPPQFDINNVTILYVATFLLAFGG